MRVKGGLVARLLHIGEQPVVVAAWQRRSGEVAFRAGGRVDGAGLAAAIERMRFALGIDDDLSEFHARFRRDPVIGPALRRRPWLRPRRRPFAWEALAWAITAQLIESSRAAEIQRRIVRRFGPSLDPASLESPGYASLPGPLRDVPPAGVIAACSPAELAARDLAAGRSLAMIRVAKEIAAGRVDPADPAGDARLLAIREIGPWTIQCLGLNGRGEADSLPAGDLGYIKLVGRLAGLGRRATIPEVEEYFAPYEPYRGLAGEFALMHYHPAVQAGPPLRLAA
ncbi:MAG: DNA-3-methyladenine glycosylase [Solirubrobacterales bacterium]|jgi:3-methyladenine DNA glycosylase/8-oxoguanine DNA glycosylase|nr:DNA-3-methyladenine glycosylase [Solirubrobacterales bacterium]